MKLHILLVLLLFGQVFWKESSEMLTIYHSLLRAGFIHIVGKSSLLHIFIKIFPYRLSHEQSLKIYPHWYLIKEWFKKTWKIRFYSRISTPIFIWQITEIMFVKYFGNKKIQNFWIDSWSFRTHFEQTKNFILDFGPYFGVLTCIFSVFLKSLIKW